MKRRARKIVRSAINDIDPKTERLKKKHFSSQLQSDEVKKFIEDLRAK
jgi:hypothetical protein